jgi:hypothetical protein
MRSLPPPSSRSNRKEPEHQASGPIPLPEAQSNPIHKHSNAQSLLVENMNPFVLGLIIGFTVPTAFPYLLHLAQSIEYDWSHITFTLDQESQSIANTVGYIGLAAAGTWVGLINIRQMLEGRFGRLGQRDRVERAVSNYWMGYFVGSLAAVTAPTVIRMFAPASD